MMNLVSLSLPDDGGIKMMQHFMVDDITDKIVGYMLLIQSAVNADQS